MELNPQVVFERMFGDGSTAEERAARRKRRPQHPRLADRQPVAACKVGLDPSDRAAPRRVHRGRPRDRAAAADCDEGLDRCAGRHDRAGRRAGDRSTSTSSCSSTCWRWRFQADITRVGTLLFARDLTGRTYPESGVDGRVSRRLASRRRSEAQRGATPD